MGIYCRYLLQDRRSRPVCATSPFGRKHSQGALYMPKGLSCPPGPHSTLPNKATKGNILTLSCPPGPRGLKARSGTLGQLTLWAYIGASLPLPPSGALGPLWAYIAGDSKEVKLTICPPSGQYNASLIRGLKALWLILPKGQRRPFGISVLRIPLWQYMPKGALLLPLRGNDPFGQYIALSALRAYIVEGAGGGYVWAQRAESLRAIYCLSLPPPPAFSIYAQRGPKGGPQGPKGAIFFFKRA